jgi:hypothetical protein
VPRLFRQQMVLVLGLLWLLCSQLPTCLLLLLLLRLLLV